MRNDSKHRRPAGLLRILAAALLVVLAGCSTLTDLFPGSSSGLEFVQPSAGSRVTVGNSVPVRVSTTAVPTPLESVHLEVDGDWVGALGDSDGDGEYTGSFIANREGGFSLAAVAVGEDGSIRRGTVDLVGEDQPGFSIVVMPDTQKMIEIESNTMVRQMTDWIASQSDELDIELVSHVGDVVEHGNSSAEWQRADSALDNLDGVVPYSVTIGNHDYAETWNKCSSTANYLNLFGPGRYDDYSWYGGSSPDGTNHYQVVEAGGRTFLHLNLEWEPRASAVSWARSVLDSHPELPTIISTHSYLTDEGQGGHFAGPPQSETEGDPNCAGIDGRGVYEALVQPYPQVFMVVNGHFHAGEDGEDGEYHQTSSNGGGKVYEILSNYQDYPSGGQGWLRIIQFIPDGGAGDLDRIAVRTYSPVLNEYQTDGNSQFHFDLSFEQRFGLN